MAVIEERIGLNSEKSYRVKLRLRGFPEQSATFLRKTDAKRWAHKTETEIREGRYFKNAEAKKHTLEESITRYLRDVLPLKGKRTQLNQKSQLKWWEGKLGNYTLADLSSPLITSCKDELLISRGPATTVRYLAVLSHLCSVAIKDWGWMDDNPMRKINKPREPRGRVRFLSTEERNTLLSACQKSSNPKLYPLVVLALCTGARKGELLNSRWSEINFELKHLTLQETKNYERRTIPLSPQALTQIKELKRLRRLGTDYVFCSTTLDSPIEIKRAWYAALKETGIHDFRFHDLRHSAASYLAMGGATTSEIASVLGHKTLSMVKRYSHIGEQHTKNVLNKMNDHIFSKELPCQK